MSAHIWRILSGGLLLVASLTGLCGTASVEAGDVAKRPLSCSLELEDLEPDARWDVLYYDLSEYHPYRPARSRHVLPARYSWLAGQATGTFSRIVSTEPGEYRSERPFRGVVTFGSRQFAFVFDTGDGGPLDYGRLYFDRNCNGDLTDDQIIEATGRRKEYSAGVLAHLCSFPRVDIRLEVDGTEFDYAFFVTARARGPNMEKIWTIEAVFSPAVCREGELTLDGESRRVVLLDYNTNGLFGDASSDRLLIATEPGNKDSERRGKLEERYVSELIDLEDRYYRLEILGVGERLTLTPLSLPIGYVTNPNKDFVALVQNDGKVLRIEGRKSERIPLPEGEWSLLSYTIHVPGLRLKGRATRDSKPVSVRRGQTAEFPFGPPLRPVTKVGSLVGQEEAVLELFLLGTAGEFCKPVIRQGSRAMPEMTISTPAGRAVVRGRFRGGCTEYSLIYQWKLPSELADEYHVRVRVKAGPFEVDDTGYSVIPRSELVRRK